MLSDTLKTFNEFPQFTDHSLQVLQLITHIKTSNRLYSFTLEYLGIGAVLGAIRSHMPPHPASSQLRAQATLALKCLVSSSDSDVEALVRQEGVSAILDAYFAALPGAGMHSEADDGADLARVAALTAHIAAHEREQEAAPGGGHVVQDTSTLVGTMVDGVEQRAQVPMRPPPLEEGSPLFCLHDGVVLVCAAIEACIREISPGLFGDCVKAVCANPAKPPQSAEELEMDKLEAPQVASDGRGLVPAVFQAAAAVAAVSTDPHTHPIVIRCVALAALVLQRLTLQEKAGHAIPGAPQLWLLASGAVEALTAVQAGLSRAEAKGRVGAADAPAVALASRGKVTVAEGTAQTMHEQINDMMQQLGQ
jgi:hypothetical protein